MEIMSLNEPCNSQSESTRLKMSNRLKQLLKGTEVHIYLSWVLIRLGSLPLGPPLVYTISVFGIAEFALLFCFFFWPSQFDHLFVEVHRVKKFRFQPRDVEVSSVEELSNIYKKTTFRPMCSTPSTGFAHSSWTCDGEILPYNTVQVRYRKHSMMWRKLQSPKTLKSESTCYIHYCYSFKLCFFFQDRR